jgi:hypothetical protein
MRTGEDALFELPALRRDAIEFCDDLSSRGIGVSLYVDRFTHTGEPAVQIQIKATCAEDDLLYVAQAARAKGFHVDAEDGALLLNVM